MPRNFISFVFDAVITLRNLPNQQEGLADVLIGRATITIDCLVDDRTDFIDEFQDILFKNLIDLCEFSDITKTKDSAFLFTLEHGVHVAFLDNVLTDNLGACTSEDNTEKGADLDDCIGDNCGLILGVHIDLFF